MSSYMYSRTPSHTTRCGSSRLTTSTFRFEADASRGRNLMLRNMRNQPSNSTPSPPLSQRTWSRYHQTQPPSSRRTWSQYNQTRSWLRIHTSQRYISMMLATSRICLPTLTTFPM